MVDLFLLFDELHYTLISLSTVILFAWFMTPYFYLVDHMISIGYAEEKGALVLSIIGIANTIGMVSSIFATLNLMQHNVLLGWIRLAR